MPVLLTAPALAGAADQEPGAPAYQQTKTLTRLFVDEETGADLVVDQRDVTVSVDHTEDLRGRERVLVIWTGARPSAGRAANPFGENGLNQEYPVVILQCRGLDDPALPAAQQLSPETCWTSTRMQRSAVHDPAHGRVAARPVRRAGGQAAQGRHHPVARPGDLPRHRGAGHQVTPFVAASAQVYPACTAETMPPEAAVGAAFPPAEIAAFTDLDGNGSAQYEVRSSVENESLGCSYQVACSLVVIPIMGLSCDVDAECARTGQFLPGSSNFANQGVDLAVSPSLWWSESNWRNRFSVPLTFGLPPDACNVLDDRPPTGFYGTELISQAALQWSPAYCLDKKRFKFQANAMPDSAAFGLMETGEAAAAFVSGKHETTGQAAVVYAPTAVTGFAVGYVVDRPDNAGEVTDLRLTPRLLAKLLTQSYLGSDLGRGHRGIADNPLSINLDPEFQKLNPGLDTISREAAATVLSLSESSDVMTALTSYIANDRKAMDFVGGKPDQWGMKVNPSYKKIELPTAEWPLLDDYVPQTQDECLLQNPAPYFTQLAAPVTSLRKIAEAVLDAWPNVQTRCERATTSDPWKLGRVVRQGMGSRFMMGIVSLGDAARFGLRAAALESGDRFVAAECRRPHSGAADRRARRGARAARARPARDPEGARRLPRHPRRLHRRPQQRHRQGAGRADRAVHRGLDDRGSAFGHRQRRAASRLPADREDRRDQGPVPAGTGGGRGDRGAEGAVGTRAHRRSPRPGRPRPRPIPRASPRSPSPRRRPRPRRCRRTPARASPPRPRSPAPLRRRPRRPRQHHCRAPLPSARASPTT